MRAPSLADKIAFLRSLCGPGDEAIETHFAWVILVGDRAYKLRKPVRREPMDYGTLAARRAGSEAEVRLNRRLAPDVYLGIRPLVVDAAGRLGIASEGTVVDWLVEMRRLDRTRFLDAVVAGGAPDEQALRRVVELLAGFYAAAVSAIARPGDYLERLRERARVNHEVLDALDAGRAAVVFARHCGFLDTYRALLETRVAGGCVVEAHGDLRPEHILLADPVAVIDCLEFDRELRLLDRAEELSFLELECGRLGAAATGRWLREQCLQRLNDDVPASLLAFYRSLRASNRARLYALRADEPDGTSPDEWRARAGEYLATALVTAATAMQ
jgi:aminoglycoside phosphotransferase family enzyme